MFKGQIKKKEKRNPWLYIPSMTLVQGMPIMLVMQSIAVILKSLGASNTLIGLTSLFMLPISFKFIWAPILDMALSKRKEVLILQMLMTLAYVFTAFMFILPGDKIVLALIGFVVISLLTAFYDMPIDGFYIVSLDSKQQAFFSGIKTAILRISYIFVSGVLVMIAGFVGESSGNMNLGWMVFFLIQALIFGLTLIWHAIISPYPPNDVPARGKGFLKDYFHTFKDFFTMPYMVLSVIFFLTYRFGEGVLVKMIPAFFLDSPEANGMDLAVSQLGFMYGTVGMVATIIGGLLGGWLVKKYTLRKTVLLFAICMTFPNIFYVFLARFTPDAVWTIVFPWGSEYSINIWGQLTILLESFGYGLGFTGLFVYSLYVAGKSKYKMSFLAIAVGMQNIGWMIPQSVSGYIQELIGYEKLFLLSVITPIPGIICAYLISKIPNLEPEEEKEQVTEIKE